MLRCVIPALALLLAASVCSAQVLRQFPPTALRGELIGTAPPDVTLNGHPARLAPGARVRNQDNRYDVIGTLAGRKLLVHYTLDSGGQLLEVWVLTASELANQPWPATAEQARSWRFDPVAQTWSRP